MSQKNGNKVYNIIAFIFTDPKKAKQVSEELKKSAKPEGYKVIANVAVEVDAKGKAHIHEAGHGRWGAGIGIVGGGLLSLLGGPVGLLVWAVAGGVIGGEIGKHMGRAIPADDLKKLAAQMTPNSSAILAMVEDKEAEALIDGMKGYKANVVTLTVGDEATGEIDQAVAAQVEAPAATPAAPKPAASASTPPATPAPPKAP